ncbi:AraC family transcriptional regulator [Myxococcota bacterium]|nr:AraC family transcriptional regulator [Myxococcota bacterium]MBU1537083.1 AraC family transcriptional regulator [Myxococcota bacterium]
MDSQSRQRREYTARINRVIDYIDAHLSEELNLTGLARVACFSPYHFHRLFGALTGETLNAFIGRLRIEKAASLLLINPERPITDIAYDCGFSSPSTFARSFSAAFGMSASRFREVGATEKSKNGKAHSNYGQAHSKPWKDYSIELRYNMGNAADNSGSTPNLEWRITMQNEKEMFETVNVELMEMEESTVAYVRHVGPYAGDAGLFERLIGRICAWAGPRGLLNFPETKIIAVYHDSPEITDESKLRTSICVNVPPDTVVTDDVGKMTLAGGKYAVGHFTVKELSDYPRAWNTMFGLWLPESGFEPADSPCFELYKNNPREHPEGLCFMDICIPVKPLQ